jgi:hypothetical protein
MGWSVHKTVLEPVQIDGQRVGGLLCGTHVYGTCGGTMQGVDSATVEHEISREKVGTKGATEYHHDITNNHLPTFVNQPFPSQKFSKVDDLLTWTSVKRTSPALAGTKIFTKVDSTHLQHLVWILTNLVLWLGGDALSTSSFPPLP